MCMYITYLVRDRRFLFFSSCNLFFSPHSSHLGSMISSLASLLRETAPRHAVFLTVGGGGGAAGGRLVVGNVHAEAWRAFRYP